MTGRGPGRERPVGARRPRPEDMARSPSRGRDTTASKASPRPQPDPFEEQRRVLAQQGD